MMRSRAALLVAGGVLLGCSGEMRRSPPDRAATPGDSMTPHLDSTRGAAPVHQALPPLDERLALLCDSVRMIASARLHVPVQRSDTATFKDWYTGAPFRSCRLGATGTFGAGSDPVGDVMGGLEAAVWMQDSRYSADGPDGSDIGYRRGDVFCLIAGHWNGGDDAEPDTARVVAPLPYSLTVDCIFKPPPEPSPR